MHQKFIGAVAGFVAAASPCAAADLSRLPDTEPARIGASVSAYLTIPLTVSRNERSRPHLGMRMSFVRMQQDQSLGLTRVAGSDVLDLQLARRAPPTLLLAGRPVAGGDRRLHALGTAGTIGVVTGAAAAVLLVGVLAWGGGFPDTCPTVGGQRDHCINP